MILRTILSSVTEGVVKLFSGSNPAGTVSAREFFQHYGFTSRPKSGAEAIVIKSGNMLFSVAEDDRNYRLAIEDGEVALYTDEGDYVKLGRNKHIQITSGAKVTVSAPEIVLDGAVTTTGAITAGGEVSDSIGTMTAMRTVYNTHTHVVSGSTAAAPAAQM